MDRIRAGWVNIRSVFTRTVIFFLVLFFLTGLVFIPKLASSAQLVQLQGTGAYLPVVQNQGGFGPTHTITPSPTMTVTGTPPSPTNTGTAGPSPTQTLTPSPTYTGTLSPNGAITMSVSGSPANIGQNLVFTILVSNLGTGPMFDNTVADSFASYLDVLSVTTTLGSYAKASHSFTAILGTVNPGVVVKIVVTVRVNNTLTRNENTSNVASLTYLLYNNTTVYKTTSANYQVIYQTLPPTGDLPLDWRYAGVNPLSMIPGILFMIAGGVLLLLLVVWSKANSSKYKIWMMVGGALLFVVGFVAAVTASGVMRPNQLAGLSPSTPTVGSLANEQLSATSTSHLSAWEFSTPDSIVPVVTLPDYPVPSPVITVTPQPGQTGPDTSEVNRIVIPVLNLDTVVKYVPFDGYTWAITGLRQEVAWMGDTSWPGLGSNTGLAGHVTVAGMGDGPFRHLDELPVGELVLVYTEKNIYTYQVRESKITTDDDFSVIQPSDNPEISLITCVDWDQENKTYLNRLVVVADLLRTEPITMGVAP